MRKLFGLTLVSLAAYGGSLQAQGYAPGVPPVNRPAFSPYLNLLRRDAPLVTQYYGLVRPQINFQNSIQQLDAQQAQTSAQQTAFENILTLPPTGHAARFMTQSAYFMTQGAGGQAFPGGFGQAGATPGAQPPQGAQATPPSKSGRR
jgi:hypothetical protein